jgi:hypothetical protein
MDEAQLLAGLNDLDTLARANLRRPLSSLVAEGPHSDPAVPISNLLTLALKHPSSEQAEGFAEARAHGGFLSFLAASAQRYVCGDAEIRKKVEDTVQTAKGSGFHVDTFTPEKLVESGGVALASLLITRVPALGFVGAPVIAGFVVILYSIGTDAFCAWASQISSQPKP